MKSFVIAVVLAVALGVGAWFLLERDFQESSMAAFSTTGVRLSDISGG